MLAYLKVVFLSYQVESVGKFFTTGESVQHKKGNRQLIRREQKRMFFATGNFYCAGYLNLQANYIQFP